MGDVIGSMNQRITVRQISGSTKDGSGAPIPTWITRGPVWAAVEFKSTGSDERFMANQVKSIVTADFTIRRNPNWTVRPTDELIYRGDTYQVRSVLEKDPKRCYLILEAEKIAQNEIA